MDELREFVAECCRFAGGLSVTTDGLYGVYEGWCHRTSTPVLPKRKFNDQFFERHENSETEPVFKGKSGSKRTWKGVAVTVLKS